MAESDPAPMFDDIEGTPDAVATAPEANALVAAADPYAGRSEQPTPEAAPSFDDIEPADGYQRIDFAQQLAPTPAEQVTARQNEGLRQLFKEAHLDDAEVDHRAGVLRFSKESGISTPVVEAAYDKFKATWATAAFDPATWRKANPELAQLVLTWPHLAPVVMRDQKLSVVSQAMNKVYDALYSPYVPEGTPGREEELARLEQYREDVKTKPGAQQQLVDDPKARYLREEAGPIGKVIVPYARYLETQQQLEISNKNFQLMALRASGRNAEAYELQKELLDLKRNAVQRDYGEGPVGQVFTDVATAAASSLDVLKEASATAAASAVVAGGLAYAATRDRTIALHAARKAAAFGAKAGGVAGTFRLEAGDAYGELQDVRTDDGKPLDNTVATGAALIYGTLAAGIEFAAWSPMLKTMGPIGELIKTGERKAALAALVKNQGFLQIAARAGKNWLAASAAEGGEEFLQQATQDAVEYFARSAQQGHLSTKGGVNVEKALMAGEKGFVGGMGLAAGGVVVDLVTQSMLRDESVAATKRVAATGQLADSPTVKASPEAAAQVLENVTAKMGRPVTAFYVDAKAFAAQAQDAKVNPFEAADQLLGKGGAQQLADALENGGKLEVPHAQYLDKWVGTDLAARLVNDTTTSARLSTATELKQEPETKQQEGSPEASWHLAERLANTEAPVDRGAEVYLDPVSGLRNRAAFDETAAPEGKQLAVITSTDVKAINDHPTAGGHDVANGLLRTMGKAIGEHDATAARSGTNFLVYVADQAELAQVLERVRAAVGPNVNLESGLGADTTAAFAALGTNVETKRARGETAPRGQPSPGLDVGALKFSDEKAQSTVPAELAKKVSNLSHEEYFRRAYVTKGGLLTATGFRAVPQKAHTIAFDMKGLGHANAIFGKAGGDALLAAFEDALVAVGGSHFDAAHLSGDEFAAQSDDPAALEEFARGLRQHLEGVTITGRNLSTGEIQDAPVQFRHGVGPNYGQADRALNAARRAEGLSAPGNREGRVQAEPADTRASGHQEARQVDLGREGGAESAARGNRPQAYPGQVTSQLQTDVEQTKRAMGLLPLFRSAAEAGMDAEQWAAYLHTQEEATSHAAQAVELRAAQDAQQRTEAWWRDQEAKERAAAATEYEELPARRALEFLRGRDPAAALPVSLSREAVEAAVGAEAARGIPMSRDGVSPDELCDMFGYPTGVAMVKALASLPDKAEWVRATAAARMAEKHPSVLEDRSRLRDVIAQGLHGPYGEKWLLENLKALQAKAYTLAENPEANRTQAIPNELLGKTESPAASAKQKAKEMTGRQTIGRLDPGIAMRLERTAARDAIEATARGNYVRAFVLTLQQLLNMNRWRELTEAREQRERFYELAVELATNENARAGLAKASSVFSEAVDLVLEALQLKLKPPRDMPLASIADVVREFVHTDDATVMFDEDLLAGLVAKPKAFRELTVDEMRQVDTFFRNVKAAARARTTALSEGKRVDREQARAQLSLEAEQNRKNVGPVSSSVSAETPAQVLARGWTEFDGSGLRPERLAMWMGGNSLKSAWFKLVVEPLQKAKHLKADLMKRVVEPLDARLTAAFKDSRFMERVDGKALFPTHREDLDAPTRVYEVFMMALHAGTASSLERLTVGRGITEEQLVAAINKHLWPAALKLVQAVWDANESLWPLARELEERQSGVAPPKLEPRPLKTRFGLLAGGYMAAKYDSRVETVGEQQVGEALRAVTDGTYIRPGTARSHLKKRADNFSGALLLEPGLILRVLDQAVHDIAFREPLKSVAGLIWDPKLQRTMRERLGTGRATQFKQYLRDVGTQAGANLTDWWSNVGRALKKHSVASVLAYRLPTALGDLSNFMLGARRIGPGPMLGGIAEVFTKGREATDLAYSKSAELRAREGQMLERFRAFLELMTKRGGRARQLLNSFDRHGFTMFEWTEKLFSVPAWIGAYRAGLNEGKNEADAVTYADAMVRRMLPAWNPVDQSAIQRNRVLSPFLMFASFHNVIYNELRDEWEPVLQALGVKDAAKKAAVAVPATLFIVFSSYVLGELLSGRGPEPGDGDDEAERWLHWAARKTFTGALMPLPVVGPDLATGVESRVLHKQANTRGGLYTAMIAPAVDAGAAMLDGNKDGEAKFFAVLKALAPLTGTATYPFATPGRYLYDVSQGQQHPRNPADVVSGATFGARKGQPENPASIVGDALNK